MDEDILRTVEKISGKLSRDCYYDLCCLVKAAIPRMPGTFSMETLYPEAQRYSEKEKDTLAKALSRAAEDIWDCGDRAELQKLFQRVLREKPTPKDLVRVLALSVWRRRKAVRCGRRCAIRFWRPGTPGDSDSTANPGNRSDIWWSCCREGNRQR
ncbi:MAG: hypothetical protein EP146_01475 [Oscillibacter sp.]|uniref:hypothetical protein n=1 Tax=Oscillibacter sp. TaxID=1945593 RepID=UPI0013268C35|nr:hypothetical protein [Oscillibacter sp.]MUU10194.1 hypothetical protein [Oscillibacter sp.]